MMATKELSYQWKDEEGETILTHVLYTIYPNQFYPIHFKLIQIKLSYKMKVDNKPV